jgi:hypothetical protein
MIPFIEAHSTIIALVGYYIFSALIGGMPAPTATSSTIYQWLFASMNILASNIARARNTAVESSPNWRDAVAKAAAVPATTPPAKP